MRLRPAPNGFTMIEMMVVVGIIATLALIAAPSLQYKVARDQILEALPLADLAKKPVAYSWSAAHTLPADNASIDLPAPDKIVSNFVSSVMVENGAVHVTFGNRASGFLKGKVLTLRPAVVEDAQVVPVAWICGFAPVPINMTAKGQNRTSVDPSYLPYSCREK